METGENIYGECDQREKVKVRVDDIPRQDCEERAAKERRRQGEEMKGREKKQGGRGDGG